MAEAALEPLQLDHSKLIEYVDKVKKRAVETGALEATEWHVLIPEAAWENGRVTDTFISSRRIDKQQEKVPTEEILDSAPWLLVHGFYEYLHEGIPIGRYLGFRMALNPKTKKIQPQVKVGVYSADWPPPGTTKALGELFDRVWTEMQEVGTQAESSIRGTWDAVIECENETCHKVVRDMGLFAVGWVGAMPGGANPDADVARVTGAKSAKDPESDLLNDAYPACLADAADDQAALERCLRQALEDGNVSGDHAEIVDTFLTDQGLSGTDKTHETEWDTLPPELVQACVDGYMATGFSEAGARIACSQEWLDDPDGFNERYKQFEYPDTDTWNRCTQDSMNADPNEDGMGREELEEAWTEQCLRWWREDPVSFENDFGKSKNGEREEDFGSGEVLARYRYVPDTVIDDCLAGLSLTREGTFSLDDVDALEDCVSEHGYDKGADVTDDAGLADLLRACLGSDTDDFAIEGCAHNYGVDVDEARRLLEAYPGKAMGSKPFAGYSDHDDCVAQNPQADDPDAYCAEIRREIEGKDWSDTVLTAIDECQDVLDESRDDEDALIKCLVDEGLSENEAIAFVRGMNPVSFPA